jgi:hypothetical protein
MPQIKLKFLPTNFNTPKHIPRHQAPTNTTQNKPYPYLPIIHNQNTSIKISNKNNTVNYSKYLLYCKCQLREGDKDERIQI